MQQSLMWALEKSKPKANKTEIQLRFQQSTHKRWPFLQLRPSKSALSPCSTTITEMLVPLNAQKQKEKRIYFASHTF